MQSNPIDPMAQAGNLARQNNNNMVTVAHLALALLDDDDVIKIVESVKGDLASMRTTLRRSVDSETRTLEKGDVPKRSAPLQQLQMMALARATQSGIKQPAPLDYLAIIVSDRANSIASAVFSSNNVTSEIVASAKHGGVSAPKMTRGEADAYLLRYGVNLNEKAKSAKHDPMIGRSEEVKQAIHVLARKKKNNPILIGGAGVGKTAIVEGLAKKIVEKTAPTAIHDFVIYSVNMGLVLAGTKYRGEFEERLALIVQSLQSIPNSVMFIDETHTVMGAGSGGGSMDAANILKPALADGSIRVIGATTDDEYRKEIESDRAMARRFGKVRIDEPSMEFTREIIAGVASTYEAFHNVTFEPEALDAIVRLTDRYIIDFQNPDKSIDILDLAGAALRMDDEATNRVITVAKIEDIVSAKTGIPVNSLRKEDRQRLRELESDLISNVVGQDHAMKSLAGSVKVASVGLREDNKPLASYLMVGPTGVGKTEAAKQLSETLGMPLKRYNMSEFMQPHTVAKLLGSPVGYVGYGTKQGDGKLISDLSENPRSVLLFDEIEKAHPSIFNIFLQMMDEGEIESSAGKKVSLKHAVILMTSNAGIREASRENVGFGGSSDGMNMEALQEAVDNAFAPEFRNRLDDVIYFNALNRDDVRAIASRFLDAVCADILSNDGVKLSFTSEAVDYVAKTGFNPSMGARPMKRVIHEKVKKVLANMLIDEEIGQGSEVFIGSDGDKLTFGKGELVEA